MDIVSTIGATSVTDSTGAEHTPNEHGIFAVPHEIGVELIKFTHWVEAHVAGAKHDAEEIAKQVDPAAINERLTQLEEFAAAELGKAHERITALEAKVTALEAKGAEDIKAVEAKVAPKVAAAKKAAAKVADAASAATAPSN